MRAINDDEVHDKNEKKKEKTKAMEVQDQKFLKIEPRLTSRTPSFSFLVREDAL